MDSWLVLIQQHHPVTSAGTTTWKTSRCSSKTKPILRNNVPAAPHVRAALCCRDCFLCAHCGRKLAPRYTGNGGIHPVYECTRRQTDAHYSSDCARIQADLIDQKVGGRILEILRPDQIEI